MKKKVNFGLKGQISIGAGNLLSGHAHRMSCDLSELLEQTRPPDSELVDLIEQAILEAQIDGVKAELGYLWLQAKGLNCPGKRENNVGPFVVLTNSMFSYYYIEQ